MSTLYIFGSGASKCAGLPVTANTMDAIFLEYRASILADGNSEDIIKVKLSHLDSIEGEYQKFKEEEKSNNIEDFIKWIGIKKIWAKMFKLAGIVYWYLWDRMHNISTIRFHKLFVKHYDKDAKIISFNYDLILEEAYEERTYNKIPVRYEYLDSKTGKQLISKPMGSINWVIRHSIVKLQEWTFDEGPTLGPEFLFDYEKQIWLIPEYVQDIADQNGGPSQFMKWFDNLPKDSEFYTNVLADCSNHLSSSEKIYIFGYSFPTDKSDKDKTILEQIFKKVKIENETSIELICGNIPEKDKWCNREESYEAIEQRLRMLFDINANDQTIISILPGKYKTFEEWVLNNAK